MKAKTFKPKLRELDLSAAVEQVEAAIEQELTKPRQARQSDADKAASAAAALKRWQTRAKRAQTYISKYRKRVRYYERKMGGVK